MPRSAQNVSIPNGLIAEVKEWVEEELNRSVPNTAHRSDLEALSDRLDAALNEID